MALGSLPSQVLVLVPRQGLVIVCAELFAGTFGALALTRLLASLLFNTTATDPLTFLAVVLLLTLVATAACSIPARRAACTDSSVGLHRE